MVPKGVKGVPLACVVPKEKRKVCNHVNSGTVDWNTGSLFPTGLLRAFIMLMCIVSPTPTPPLLLRRATAHSVTLTWF